MRRLQRAALLVVLAEKLLARSGRCGETHLQKTTFFLEELLELPTGFSFILYKNGPFSFDLRNELALMRADGLLELRVEQIPCGPSLVPTVLGTTMCGWFQKTVARYASRLDFVAESMGGRKVGELERMATALYITKRETGPKSPEQRARRLTELKPHVSAEEAESAIVLLAQIIEKACASFNVELPGRAGETICQSEGIQLSMSNA